MAYEILQDKSFAFAVRIVKLYRHLKEKRENYGIGDQVLRSGTSIGANIAEAVYAQSNSDNIAKLSISLKEANETRYWLKLMIDTQYISQEQGLSLIADNNELIRMLVKALKTLKQKKFER